jgi:hypothetical protein
MKRTQAELHEYREQEVLREARLNRGTVSSFWLSYPLTRWAAMERLEKSGKIVVKDIGYPLYRIWELEDNS